MKFSFSKKYYRWIAELTLILLLLSSLNWWMTRDAVSGKVPEINGLLLDGKQYKLSGLDKPVLIYFWASWCPVCEFTSPNVESVAEDHEVISVAMQSGNEEELKAYMNENNLTFDVINDVFGDLSHQFNVKGVPMFYIVDSERNVKFVERGYTSEAGLRLRLWWTGL